MGFVKSIVVVVVVGMVVPKHQPRSVIQSRAKFPASRRRTLSSSRKNALDEDAAAAAS
jgi:hypothetical protein